MRKALRIATRNSPLALWQSHYVKRKLLEAIPGLKVSFLPLTTRGDHLEGVSALSSDAKSLFVKPLQEALLGDEADIAVHSIKDMSVHEIPGLCLAAICERDDPRDALVSRRYASLTMLPEGAIVGTSSPRRTALLKAQRPDLRIKVLRGNVKTRLIKYDRGDYDAIVLAVAGLKRLKLTQYIAEYLEPNVFIPAIGQGAIGVECRVSDARLRTCLQQVLNHFQTASCVYAERAVNQVLGGDCMTPIGAYAIVHHHQIFIYGMVGSVEGDEIVRAELIGTLENAIDLGRALARKLLDKGAKRWLD